MWCFGEHACILRGQWTVTQQFQKTILTLVCLCSWSPSLPLNSKTNMTILLLFTIIREALFHFYTPSIYCLFIEQYVNISSFWDMFVSFNTICIYNMYILNVPLGEIWAYPVFVSVCSVLVYLRYTNTDIDPCQIGTWQNILFTSKQPNKINRCKHVY